ncbi:hypothetical protein GBAR_LOCUS16928 [Geodia barretti]|uniref:Uncharacterized protein n=1 Tax=Geodia barretti TaxID=519541 RepID=A0AA35SIJ9_GEOBA|nr:hypothetical protein GBAR_LOCUS16928 [Geodia barretti]
MDITIMDSCCSKASPAPKGQGVETDQDVPTSHGTEAQQRPASSPEALQQLRESLKPKFESVDTDGGMPIVFELPNGEKLTYNTDIMSCSTKMLYEYVFYAGLVNQRFRIFSGPARRPIPCNHSKISEINFTVEGIEVGGYYIQVDTSSGGTLGFTYVSGNQWRYKRAKGDCFDVSTPSNGQGQVQIKLGKTILTVEEKENKLMEPQFMESMRSTETMPTIKNLITVAVQIHFIFICRQKRKTPTISLQHVM